MKFEDSIKIIIVGILLIILNGCMFSKNMKKKNPYEMSCFSNTNIEGVYSNKIEGEKRENFGLWNLLIRSYKEKVDTIEVNNDMFVKLTMHSHDSLNVKLLENNS